MSTNIFLIGTDNALTELTRSPYDSEDLLQRLIADHPSLLGSTTGADGGLLLVRREHAVPDSQDGVGRWSLDHLFLDRNAVPTLVEVKRASDTRARREVVAQMLDYAANGVAYWPIEDIIKAFRASCEAAGFDPETKLTDFLGSDEPEAFWRAAEANLRSGRIRMVFLADEISKELRRIVEFLNEQMRPAEVLAVEVVQYVNPNGMRTLVPKLLGATERAQSTKTLNIVQDPILEDVVSVYDEAAPPGLATNGKAVNWRNIKPFPTTGLVHYEFMHLRKDRTVGVELHVEGDKFTKLTNALPNLLKKLEGKYTECELRYDPKWSKSRGRIQLIFSEATGARIIAQAMHQFIGDTRADVEALIAQ
ncbi:hypothetical protein ACETIH_03075 [Microvirga arabica]|uniref:DUF91 domain-containing protein n=1 Tax=Microvirga arabica TaxID=1128671 RepID=A0ABV6Y3L4_9HYPH